MQQQFLFQSAQPQSKEGPPSGDGLEAPPGEPPPEMPGGGGDPPRGDHSVSLLDAARERYLNYALSVITARALPDVRDGLKPVQRRILYAMWARLHLQHTARFRKSAAVVGEVMARFHPHGDQSIYDAMVRMAQPFSMRLPLVEGHGNFGSLDGDPPAAMRYTEARLQAVAAELVSEIDSETVPFRANYDGTTAEPVVLPSRIPNLLVNGVAGIAVGMATNIPPHNLREVCRAAVALIDDPRATLDQVLQHIEGPDFPSGGEILNSPSELRAIYESGRGSIRQRATWKTEKSQRRRWLVIDSIPYGQNKAQIVQQIGDLVAQGKVPQLLDVRDESTDDVRIVCELRRGASDKDAMAFLLRHTGLRLNFGVNLTVLLPTANPEVGTPLQVGLVRLLQEFCRFRFEVVTARFRFELERLRRRVHILRGFAIVFDALDEAIALIRASDGKADAARRLMARFPLDDVQTEAILELKLYRLARLEIGEVRAELARLLAEMERIEAILASEAALWGVVRGEMLEVAAAHGDDRRTRVGGGLQELEFDPNKYIVERNTWVIFTRDGWMKRQQGFSDIKTIRVRDGDAVETVIRASTRSTIAIFTSAGRCYVLRVDDIQQTSGHGEPVQRRFAFADGEQIVGVVSMDPRNLPEHTLRVPVSEVEADGEDEAGENGADGENGAEVEDGAEGDEIGDEAPTVEGMPGEPEEPGEAPAEPPEADEADTIREGADGDALQDVGPVAVAICSSGKGLLLPLLAHIEPSTRNGRKFMSVVGRKGETVIAVVPLAGPDGRLALATEKGRVALFPVEQLKLLRSAGKGVNALRVGKGDRVLDFRVLLRPQESLEVETNRGRRILVWDRKFAVTNRGGKGFVVAQQGSLVRLPRPPVVIDPLMGQEEPEELSDEEIEAEMGDEDVPGGAGCGDEDGGDGA